MKEGLAEGPILWMTNVGSHMWKMQNKDSDIDLFVAYVVPTREYLKGRASKRSIAANYRNRDLVSHEIGKIIYMLVKGNVNFVWGITSPIVEYESGYLEELKKIYVNNMSKNIYHSIHGLAIHNYRRYIKTGLDTSPKKIKTILRTVKFGIRILEKGEIKYKRVSGSPGPEDIKNAIAELENAYENSNLPETPNEELFYDFLYEIRIKEWIGRINDIHPLKVLYGW